MELIILTSKSSILLEQLPGYFVLYCFVYSGQFLAFLSVSHSVRTNMFTAPIAEEEYIPHHRLINLLKIKTFGGDNNLNGKH